MDKVQRVVACVLAVASCRLASADGIVEFERNADEWLATLPNHESRAFDEFFPGLPSGGGCLVDPPLGPAVLKLTGGTITLRAVDTIGGPACAILDGSTHRGAVSGGAIINGGAARLIMEFSPPISAIYVFYGSLRPPGLVTMHLSARGVPLGELVGPSSDDDVFAVGHGFCSALSIDRIDFLTTDGSLTVLGAFVGLAEGEPSLGTVTIPGYEGPNGEIVELDFACVFSSPLTCLRADLNGDGTVDLADLLIVLAFWGECEKVCLGDIDEDGTVGFADLLIVLSEWGPCEVC